MARSVMEGVTLGLAYGLNRFRALGIRPTEIRLTGGGSKSSVWRQICADVFGVPTVCLKSAEGAALGAAIQAAFVWHSTTGKPITFRELCARLVQVNASTRCIPSENHTEIYAPLLSRQGELTHRLHSAGML
jgi:xylulokinase